MLNTSPTYADLAQLHRLEADRVARQHGVNPLHVGIDLMELLVVVGEYIDLLHTADLFSAVAQAFNYGEELAARAQGAPDIAYIEALVSSSAIGPLFDAAPNTSRQVWRSAVLAGACST